MNKRYVLSLIMLFSLILGCGGGSGGGSGKDNGKLPDDQDNNTVDVSGEWKGTMTTNNFGETQTVMVLKQDGSNISGEIDFGKSHSDNISGSVDNSTVTLSIMFLTTEKKEVEFALEGKLNSNTYSGTLTIYFDGKVDEKDCKFSFQRDGNTPPNPNPGPNPQPHDIDMSAVWEGNMSSALLGDREREASLTLEQNGSTITGKMTFDGVFTDEVTGSVDNSTVNITVSGYQIVKTRQSLGFDLEGQVNGNTFSGTFKMLVDNKIEGDDGKFSFTKNGNEPPNPNPQPPNPDQKRYEIEVHSCFQLSTGEDTKEQDLCNNMDMEFLEGAKVDPYSDGDIFCVQDGTYENLASVPDDYSNCKWYFYMEGAGGLENTGVLLRDLSMQHHYKMRIIENELPTITFEYEQID